MNVGKLSLEWLDEMVSFSTDKYFANETVEDTLKKRRILKRTSEKTLKRREPSFDSTNISIACVISSQILPVPSLIILGLVLEESLQERF